MNQTPLKAFESIKETKLRKEYTAYDELSKVEEINFEKYGKSKVRELSMRIILRLGTAYVSLSLCRQI